MPSNAFRRCMTMACPIGIKTPERVRSKTAKPLILPRGDDRRLTSSPETRRGASVVVEITLVKNVVAGASAIDIKRGLDRATKRAIEALKALSRPVKTRKETAQVAAISAHNDSAIGELVADALEKVGSEGVITVEESKTTETAVDVVEGMRFDRGFLSPYFITNPEKMEAVMEDTLILISDRKIGVLKDLLPLLDEVGPRASCSPATRRGGSPPTSPSCRSC
jgi:hypothetical protein